MTNWLITDYGLRRGVRLHKSSAPSGRLRATTWKSPRGKAESEGANKNEVAVSNEKTGKIIASEAARATLAAMKARHGAIILHVTGGWSKAALVLPAGELRIGPRDILLGEVDGVAIYEMQITPDGLGAGGRLHARRRARRAGRLFAGGGGWRGVQGGEGGGVRLAVSLLTSPPTL